MNMIIDRNESLLDSLLSKYNLEMPISDLVAAESIFLSEENTVDQFNTELKRAILYTNTRVIRENGEIIRLDKIKKIALYNFGKKIFKKLSEEEIKTVISELRLIAMLVKQLKFINKIKKEEFDIKEIIQKLRIKCETVRC